MSYVNTGYARNTVLTVTKGSYSQSYDIRAGFTHNGKTYPSLSDDDFAQLTDANYERRRADFIAFVYSNEDGLQTDCPDLTLGSVEYDTVLCPLSNVDEPQHEEE